MSILGKTLQLRVNTLVYQGDGLGRYQGKAVFIPFTAPKDVVSCRIVEEKRSFLRGVAERVVIPSPLRVEPRCPHFTRCGGCQWQHLDYEAQLNAKREIFASALERNASVAKEVVGEIIPSPEEWGYRSRCLLRCKAEGGNNSIGFYSRKSREVVDVEKCPILRPELNRILSLIRQRLKDVVYLFSDVQMEVGDEGAPRVMVGASGLAKRGEGKRLFSKATEALREVAEAEGFSLLVRDFKGEVSILNQASEPQIKPLHGSEMTLKMDPLGFFQGNLDQNRNLVGLVLRLIDRFLPNPSQARVLDLFCGMGNLSVPLATMCGEVVGVEAYPLAVDVAWRNARQNGVANVRFVKEKVASFLKSVQGEFQAVVMDPPRIGAKRETPLVAGLRPKLVIYVSCDPMTLARDLRELISVGYKVVSSTPIDMFPQTFHIESVTALTAL